VQVAGITIVEPDRTLVLLRSDVPDDPTEENPYHVVYHEYVHGVLGRTLRLPPWLSEGLAEYWGSTKITDREIEFGRAIGMHVLTLRREPTLPLQTLFQVDRSSPHYSEQSRATIFYAESWALVHYLALGAPGRSGQLNRLAGLLAEGRDPLVVTGEVLGDVETLRREIEEYARRRAFKYHRRPRRWAGDDSPGNARRLSRAEVLALRGGVLLSVKRPGEGRALIQEALTLDPGLVTAAEALGIAAFRADDREAARQWLTRAADGGRAGFFTHYALGVLASFEKNPDALARAEAELRETVRLNPEFAPAVAALAGVVVRRGGSQGEALQLLQRAIELDPNDAVIRLGVAIELLRLRRPDEARRQAELAARLAPDARAASRAAELLRQIGERDVPDRSSPSPGPVEAAAPEAPGPDSRGGSDDQPARLYEERCDEGEPAACLALAEKLEQGLGLAVDKGKATRLRAKACAAGWRPACPPPPP
jgi:tetratricopeptide (TPR) repeat protein